MLNIPLANGIQTQEYTPGLLARKLSEELPEIEYAVSVKPGYETGVITAGDTHIKVRPEFVDRDFFNVFSYDITEGNKNQVLSDKNGLLLSDELARKLFNTTTNIVGKSVQWGEDSMQYTISGVFKNPPNATDRPDLLFSYQLYFEKHLSNLQNWQNSSPSTYVILKKGTDIAQLNNKLAVFIQSKDNKSKATLFLRRYSDRYLYDKYENGIQAGGRIEYVRLFSIIAFFILVIACIIFMNLSTAKAAHRLKETGIKKVMGASRTTLLLSIPG